MKQYFVWADQHTEAFTKAKELVSTAPYLRYSDFNSSEVLHDGASEYGLAAALPLKSSVR